MMTCDSRVVATTGQAYFAFGQRGQSAGGGSRCISGIKSGTISIWGKFFLTGRDLGKALFELLQELFEVKSYVHRPVRLQVGAGAVIQLARSANVAVAEVVQGDSGLNQALIEFARRPLVFGPQLFPGFVGLEEVADVEMGDAGQIERRVVGGFGHRWVLARGRSQPRLGGA